MPSLANHKSSELVKLLAMGDSKSGKTGSLVSLVRAGYKLRILDLDNLLDPLRAFVMRDCPELVGNVEYRTLRDRRKATPVGPEIDGKPTAYIDAIRMLDRWRYKDEDGREVDLGPPADWGPDCVLVIDSLSRLCDAAYDFRLPLAVRGKSGEVDLRAVYGDAQDAIENNLANLTSDDFRTNVIVIAHVMYMDLSAGGQKGFPQGVGQKLSPKIPQYFPTVMLYTNRGGKRTIRTNSTPLIDLANPKPFEMQPEYDIGTGLADIFTVLRGSGRTEPKPEPKALDLSTPAIIDLDKKPTKVIGPLVKRRA